MKISYVAQTKYSHALLAALRRRTANFPTPTTPCRFSEAHIAPTVAAIRKCLFSVFQPRLNERVHHTNVIIGRRAILGLTGTISVLIITNSERAATDVTCELSIRISNCRMFQARIYSSVVFWSKRRLENARFLFAKSLSLSGEEDDENGIRKCYEWLGLPHAEKTCTCFENYLCFNQ